MVPGAALWFAMFVAQQDFTADAMKALEANQPAVAEPLLRKAIAADPKDYAAHFNLALALSLQNKNPDAEEEYRQTLALKPGLYQADLNLGILLLRRKQPGEAIPLLKDAVAAKPKEARPNLYLADALLGTGDATGAMPYYTVAAEADPKNAAAQLGWGRALLATAKLPEAAEHYRAAAAIDPTYKDALLELASEYEKAKQTNEAVEIYRQFPLNAGAQERLGELLIESKDFAAAIPKLEQSVGASPTPANRLALGTAYKMNKQPDKAAEQFRLASQADPGNYDLRMIYGRELRDMRQFIPAAQQFAAAANRKPDSVEAWNELASVLIVAENYAQGLAALDRVKALGKETPGNHYLRAITLDKLKQLKPALASYQQFLETDGGKLQDEEFRARQRIRIIENELKKK